MTDAREADKTPEGRLGGLAGGTSLALFALILMLIDLTGVHPSLPGRTGAEQIQQLANQAGGWMQVHAAFSVAAILGMAGLFWLYWLVLPGGLRPVAHAAAGVGAIGAVVFFATVFAEVVMIPQLAKGCAAAPPCLSSGNIGFTEVFADVGWRVLPGLDYGARLFMAGITSLALLGWATETLRTGEFLPLLLGAGYELVGGTGLHGWGNFSPENGFTGISAVLVMAGAVAITVRRASRRPDPAAPALPADSPGRPDAAPPVD